MTNSRDEQPPVAPGMSAALGTGLLIGLAITSVAIWQDRHSVFALEKFTEPTAVGDLVFYKLPKSQPPAPQPVLTYEGKPLAPVSYEALDPNDSWMQRIGRDEASGLSIYRTDSKLKIEDGKVLDPGPDDYFIKIDKNRFLHLRPIGTGAR